MEFFFYKYTKPSSGLENEHEYLNEIRVHDVYAQYANREGC